MPEQYTTIVPVIGARVYLKSDSPELTIVDFDDKWSVTVAWKSPDGHDWEAVFPASSLTSRRPHA
jgi:hypothetical protein